jgi:hypothetical protein
MIKKNYKKNTDISLFYVINTMVIPKIYACCAGKNNVPADLRGMKRRYFCLLYRRVSRRGVPMLMLGCAGVLCYADAKGTLG